MKAALNSDSAKNDTCEMAPMKENNDEEDFLKR